MKLTTAIEHETLCQSLQEQMRQDYKMRPRGAKDNLFKLSSYVSGQTPVPDYETLTFLHGYIFALEHTQYYAHEEIVELRKQVATLADLEAALRSAPPSGPRQAIPLCPKCQFGMTDMTDRLVCSDCGHVIRPPAYQAFFVKTNAGEERKDLAKVPAAPCKLADSSVGDGVVTTEHLDDSQGTIPAEDTSSSRLRSKSGSAHCSSKAGLGGETAPTADGLAPQDSDGDVAEQQFPAARLTRSCPSLNTAGRDDSPLPVHDGDSASTQSGPQDSPSPICPMCCKPVIEPSRSEWISVEEFFQAGDWFPFHAGVRQNLGEFEKRLCIAFAKAYIALPSAPPSPAREKEKAE